MAVRIRLKRIGTKNVPSYRIVVADGRSPRDGRFIEQIGTYPHLLLRNTWQRPAILAQGNHIRLTR